MNSNTGEEAERGRHVLQLFVLARVEKESCFPKSNSNGFAIKLGILVFFWKKSKSYSPTVWQLALTNLAT